jgi:N4-(beta-N-acetylglucosaminyl)-L-asparaginase
MHHKNHNSRRGFVKRSLASLIGMTTAPMLKASNNPSTDKALPMVVSTWHNKKANEVAWKVLQSGGTALDAVEQGVKVVEANPDDRSVGLGGRPDRDGKVTLDAAIMDEKGNCGAVCFLQDILHPISVARKVMEETPHVMLAGEGARSFALAHGFEATNLLTDVSEKDWEKWKEHSEYKPIINIENHDTIGMLALDSSGNISGACTTSGLAYKISGRVGDSPIIGAGLYIDNEVGGAVATGLGESIMKTCGTFLVVELMRQGWNPTAACQEVVKRIVKKQPGYEDFQVGFLSLNKAGEVGAFGLHKGFSYGIQDMQFNEVRPSKSYL